MRTLPLMLTAALLAFSAPAYAEDYVMMKINGQDVSSQEVKALWNNLFPAGEAPAFESAKPEMRDRVLRALMAERILYGEAVKQGVDKSPKLAAELEDVKKKLIVRQFLDSKSADISEAEVKKEYDAMAAQKKDEMQVKARHILLSTEAEAKDARKKLDAGKKFEEVAREFSKDPGSAKNGGDLGFFTRETMVKEFSDAAFAMKKGEISQPVKSPFGWHIIQVLDRAPVPQPSFAEVKGQIKARLQEKRLNDYIASQVKAADVKLFDAKGKEIPFERNLPAPDAKAKN
jgi:peptidyl-prolyl cis-trans isomerase C